MAAPKARSATERLQALPLEIKRVEKQIDDAMLTKREILCRDGAASAAAVRVRRELRDLKDLRLDLIAEKAELEPIAGREWQQQARKVMPTDLPSVLAALSALEPELVRLDAIPWQARNAGQQAVLDTLRQRQYYLTGLAGRMRPAEETKIA